MTASLGVGRYRHPILVKPLVAQAQLISHSVLAWGQADAAWLDSLYRVGQTADQLVQQQLDGDPLSQLTIHHHVWGLHSKLYSPAVLQE